MLKFLFPITLLIYACTSESEYHSFIPEGAKVHTIELEKTGLTALICLPPEFDSTGAWDFDVCTGTGRSYGFSDSSYEVCQPKTGLYFPKHHFDSVRHCIFVDYSKDLPPDTISLDTLLSRTIKRRALNFNHTYPFASYLLFWGIESVPTCSYAYFAVKNECLISITKGNRLPTEALSVTVRTPDTSWVQLCFECQGPKCDSFANKMLPYVRTIKFEKNREKLIK
jgi:hypothetical protein